MKPETWTVERHLEGLPNTVVDLYERFIVLVEECGPFAYHVTKTAIALKVYGVDLRGPSRSHGGSMGFSISSEKFATSEFVVYRPTRKGCSCISFE